LPFVCKKPPAGQLSPCSCSGVSDEDHFGGSCKSWTPGEKAWSTPWCYVAKNCERAVKQENGRFKATCVDPNAAPKTTTAAVSTKFSGDAQCDAGKFQKDADTCVDCKTCSDGKVPSSNFGDRCGAINPKNQKPQPAFRDHDFTCCTPYFTKVAECAKDSKGASPSTSCRGGKDFTCQECPAGTYYPVRKDCQNAAFVAKNSKLCRCLPCDTTISSTTTTATSHWEESSCGCSSLIADHLETTVQDDPVPNRRIFSSTSGVQTNAIDVSCAIDKATNNTFLGRFEIAVQMYLEDLA